jgi:site-specific recombinase XerC
VNGGTLTPLLLLSPDRKYGRDEGTATDAGAVVVRQLSLGLCDLPARPVARSGQARTQRSEQPEKLIESFRRRLLATGASPKTQAAYIWQIEQLLAAARGLTLTALFQNSRALGRALVDDRAARGGRLSRWTLAQRRAALRSFARLVAPELRPVLSVEPEEVVIMALRSVAERIGGGFRLSGGTPRRRGGHAPIASEVAAIIAAAGTLPGFQGRRNRAFFTLLAETGSRVNALREIDGQAIHELPGGRLRLFLHAKGCRERREIEVSARSGQLLREYVGTFNGLAAYSRRLERIGIGVPGPFWRSTWRHQWSYANVARTFEWACSVSGAHAYSLHSLRRAFASDAASSLPRHVVAQAGGWQGLERLDNHYVQPRATAIAQKLGYRPLDQSESSRNDRAAFPV